MAIQVLTPGTWSELQEMLFDEPWPERANRNLSGTSSWTSGQTRTEKSART